MSKQNTEYRRQNNRIDRAKGGREKEKARISNIEQGTSNVEV